MYIKIESIPPLFFLHISISKFSPPAGFPIKSPPQLQFVTHCYTGEKHSDQKVVNIYING